jgi:hypothetical protein
MIAFAAAFASSELAPVAASAAARRARAALGGATPALAVAFASPSLEDVDGVVPAIEAEVGPIPVSGGTAGGAVFDEDGVATRGVVVVLIGGDGVCATTVTVPITSRGLTEVVPAAARLVVDADEAAGRGFGEALCLAFAPGVVVDGEAFVAAIRKGTAARMQLAGGLVGDDFTFDRARVFADGGAHGDRVSLTGVFTRKPIGVAARHGWRAVGATRVVTRNDGPWLVALDGRRAIDAWTADIRITGARPPPDPRDLLAFLANQWELGIEIASSAEPLVRAPMALRADGAVLLSGEIGEGTRVRLMHASTDDMLAAAGLAARLAHERVGGQAAGALLLSCSGRLAALGDDFRREAAGIAETLDAPVAGACVFGEIARAHREVDAFHNTTVVVLAFPRS